MTVLDLRFCAGRWAQVAARIDGEQGRINRTPDISGPMGQHFPDVDPLFRGRLYEDSVFEAILRGRSDNQRLTFCYLPIWPPI